MWGQHLKKRGDWWHYFRHVPIDFQDLESKKTIAFSLRTRDVKEAKLRAEQITVDLNTKWNARLVQIQALGSTQLARKHHASRIIQEQAGFEPKDSDGLTDAELLTRLRRLILGGHTPVEQKAILGIVEPAEATGIQLNWEQALDRFWEHVADEVNKLTKDQRRTRWNTYKRSIEHFNQAVGEFDILKIERKHALQFRKWWVDRLGNDGMSANTANREIGSLRRIIAVNLDLMDLAQPNPFARIRLKEEVKIARVPITIEQVEALAAGEFQSDLHPDFQRLIRLLVNTGMRPTEAIGLELGDLHLDHEIPHVHVRRNSIRGLKTDHSERLLPLVGVSLKAAKELQNAGGWGKRAGKNMVAAADGRILSVQHFRSIVHR